MSGPVVVPSTALVVLLVAIPIGLVFSRLILHLLLVIASMLVVAAVAVVLLVTATRVMASVLIVTTTGPRVHLVVLVQRRVLVVLLFLIGVNLVALLDRLPTFILMMAVFRITSLFLLGLLPLLVGALSGISSTLNNWVWLIVIRLSVLLLLIRPLLLLVVELILVHDLTSALIIGVIGLVICVLRGILLRSEVVVVVGVAS